MEAPLPRNVSSAHPTKGVENSPQTKQLTSNLDGKHLHISESASNNPTPQADVTAMPFHEVGCVECPETTSFPKYGALQK